MNPIKLPARSCKPKPNPDFVLLLENALPLLWSGVGKRNWGIAASERYICLAICEGAPEDMCRITRGELIDLIEARIEDGTFDTWAHSQEVYDTPSIQAGRRAFVLDLIEEFT